MPRRNRNVRDRNTPRQAQRQPKDTTGTHPRPRPGPHRYTVPTVREILQHHPDSQSPADADSPDQLT